MMEVFKIRKQNVFINTNIYSDAFYSHEKLETA